MIVDILKRSILKAAFEGKITNQREEEQLVLNITKINKDYKKIKEIKPEDAINIPSNWIQKRFGEVVKITSGQDLSSDRYFEKPKENSIPYLTGASNIDEKGNVIINRFTSTPTSTANKGNILLTCKGTIGQMAFLNEEKVHIARQFMALESPEINLKYIYYFLNASINDLLSNAKSMIPGIDRDFVLNLIIPIPPQEEQQRIVNRIDDLFEKLDELKPIEQELQLIKSEFPEKMKKSILQDAFSGKLIETTFDNWNEKKLIQIADIYTGNSISVETKKRKYTNLKDGYNYIATKDLEIDHKFNYDNGIKIPFNENSFKYADKNDILMCIEGGSAGKKIGILSEKVCFGNKLCKFSVIDENVSVLFLYYYLQSPVFLRNFYDNMSGIIGGVSINKIKSIKIKYPSLSEQQEIVDKIEQLLNICRDVDDLV